jgi:hypothetical protein
MSQAEPSSIHEMAIDVTVSEAAAALCSYARIRDARESACNRCSNCRGLVDEATGGALRKCLVPD